MKKQKLAKGWTQKHITQLAVRHDNQTDVEQAAEIEAALIKEGCTMIAVPVKLVPRVTRPAFILVFAILHLVIGGLGFFIDICGGIAQAAGGARAFTGPNNPQQAELQQNIQKNLKEKIPAYDAYTYGSLAVSFFLSISLLVAGMVNHPVQDSHS